MVLTAQGSISKVGSSWSSSLQRVLNLIWLQGSITSATKKVKKERRSAKRAITSKRRLNEIPAALRAKISLVADLSPITIEAALSVEKGIVQSRIWGMAKATNLATEIISTFFKIIFWANKRSWLTAKIKKKKRKATSKERPNSRKIYLRKVVKVEPLRLSIPYTPVEPNP